MPSPKMQTALDGGNPLPNGKQWVAGYWRSDPRWTVKATTPTKKTESSPATAAQRKKKKPSIRRGLSKKKTKPEVARAPKRSNSDPPDSCGKEGDPHDLDRGKLATDRIHLSAKSRRRLDNRYVGAGGLTIREAGLA